MPASDDRHRLIYAFPSRLEPGPGGALSLSWPAGVDPFGVATTLPGNDALQTIRAQMDALTPEECRLAVECGEAAPRTDGRVELGDDAYRVSHIAWILPGERTAWLFHRLALLFGYAAREYGFELAGFVDPLQYTCYGPGQHFDWHMDLGPGSTSTRKLSLTIQLSDDADYAGGALEFVNAPGVQAVRRLGTATFFPSYLAHRVTGVTSGMRRSLVAWACGPAFR
jgi:PKHD-type hydroxylase